MLEGVDVAGVGPVDGERDRQGRDGLTIHGRYRHTQGLGKIDR